MTTTPRDDAPDDLWTRFVDPPDDARPRAWWHWMDGNADAEGAVADLRWLHRVGVRGVHLFDGGMGMPLVVDAPRHPGTPEWDDAIEAAVAEAERLGMEIAIATSAGWSASGGPWVTAADAMKKLVWSETVVHGGAAVDVTLPPLPDTAGGFQDAPRHGSDGEPRWCTDWRVLAFPASPGQGPLSPTTCRSAGAEIDGTTLTDGAFGHGIRLPRDPDVWSEAALELDFDEPVTARSVVLGLPGPRGFGAAPPPLAILQADDGDGFRDIVRLEPTTVVARTATFAAVTARRFRLLLSAASAADALPPMAAGVRMPPVLRRADAFEVTEFALFAAARVHHAETKAGFGVEADFYAADTIDDGALAIDPAAVIDLTGDFDGERLRWDAPVGTWRILRLGASPTGQTNGPAPAVSTGLEVDKLDGRRVAAYLETHLDRYRPRTGRFTALLSDSIEAGSQNFTDDIAERFRSARGYDPTPWLPTLAGYLVDGAEPSDGFLYDYRRTLSELLTDEYYGTLSAEARRRGMTSYAEALEDGRPQWGDDLAMRGHADVPMGAMWTFPPDEGPKPTYVADLKGASSVAHVHGRSWTGAEAFTSFGDPWGWTPANLKHIADLQLALGVTRFCLHTSPHQPASTPPPGIALAPFLGQAFTRHETWAEMAGPWIDYLARCSAVLSAGRPAVEVAVFVGEEAPVTGLYERRFDTCVPPDFDFDYLGVDGLGRLSVDDDGLRAGHSRYRVLFLGGSSRRMTVATLRRLVALVDAGAAVVGSRPEGTPSQGDDRSEFGTLVDRVWGAPGVVETDDLKAALAQLGIAPARPLTGAPARRIARVVGERRIDFLANPSDHAVTVTMHDVPGPVQVWDPVGVRRRDLRPTEGRIELTLAPFGSVFVVDGPAAAPDAVSRRVTPIGEWSVELPGSPPVRHGGRPHPFTEDGPAARAFSGTAVYRARLTAPDAGTPVRTEIDLGAVHGVARVRVNGRDCGIAWTDPYRVDVTEAWRTGENEMEVEVAVPWRNRLIAEAENPTGELFAPMTQVFAPGAEPRPGGLSGPVTLVVNA